MDLLDCRASSSNLASYCTSHGKSQGYQFTFEECNSHCLGRPNCIIYRRHAGTGTCWFFNSLDPDGSNGGVPQWSCGVKKATQASSQSLLETGSANELLCFDPQTQDAQSLNCDCYERWEEKCNNNYANVALGECMKNMACASADVCSGWKNAECAQGRTACCTSRASALLQLHNSSNKEVDSSSNTKAAGLDALTSRMSKRMESGQTKIDGFDRNLDESLTGKEMC